jgi:hypothetical protein
MKTLALVLIGLGVFLNCTSPEEITAGEYCTDIGDAYCMRLNDCDGTSYSSCLQTFISSCCGGVCGTPTTKDPHRCQDAFSSQSCASVVNGVVPVVCQ